jgi:hypothetical protein
MNDEDTCALCSHPREHHEVDTSDEGKPTICGECMVSNFRFEIRRAEHDFEEPVVRSRLN